MNTKKLTAAMATTALVLSVPLITVYTGAAVAVGHSATPAVQQAARAATTSRLSGLAERAAATSRLSGLPFGGAAAYNAEVDGTPPTNATAIAYSERAARAAATSRLSGLPEGGAAVWA